jgi:hypothetical protein
MNPDDLNQLFSKARNALAAGEDTVAVNSAISRRTGGAISDFGSLERAVAEIPQQPEKPARMPMGDLARMATQGATLGFADELAGLGAALVPGGRGYEEARDVSRARVGRLRREYPMQSLAAEMAGGMVLPGMGGARAGGAALRATGSRMAAGLAGGVTGGAVGGALTGAGESEAGRRLEGALTGGLIGGVAGGALGAAVPAAGRLGRYAAEKAAKVPVLGRPIGSLLKSTEERFAREASAGVIQRAAERAGVTPRELYEQLGTLPAGSVPADVGPELSSIARAALNEIPALRGSRGPMEDLRRRMKQRGTRIISYLKSAANPDASFDQSKRLAEEIVDQVRDEFYGPLEAAIQDVRDLPNISSMIAGGDEIFGRLGIRTPSLDRPITFKELQDLRIDVRDEMTAALDDGRPGRAERARSALRMMDDVIAQDIPEFGEANHQYFIAQERLRAHNAGLRAINKSAYDVSQELQELVPEAQDTYRLGLLEAFTRKLGQRSKGGATATALIDAGDEMLNKMRALAQSDENFERFIRQGLDTETLWAITMEELAGNSSSMRQLMESRNLRRWLPQSAQEATSSVVNFILGEVPGEGYAMRRMLGEQLLGPVQPFREGLMSRVLSPSYEFFPGLAGAMGAQAGGQRFRKPVELELKY